MFLFPQSLLCLLALSSALCNRLRAHRRLDQLYILIISPTKVELLICFLSLSLVFLSLSAYPSFFSNLFALTQSGTTKLKVHEAWNGVGQARL